jgi:hypothetical protein
VKVVHAKCDNRASSFRFICTAQIVRDEVLRAPSPISASAFPRWNRETRNRIRSDTRGRTRRRPKKLRERDFTNIRIGFTAMNENVGEMRQVYDLACSLGVQFTTAVAQNSDIYFSTQVNTDVKPDTLHDALGYVMKHELMSYHPKRWLRAYFESGTLVFNREKKRFWRAARDRLLLPGTEASSTVPDHSRRWAT